jgi:S1-C subfamily serine protease
MHADTRDPPSDSTVAYPPVHRSSNSPGSQMFSKSRLAGVVVAVTFVAVTVALALSQAFAPAPRQLHQATTQSSPAIVIASAPAPEGSVMAVAEAVGPAVVSVRTDQGLGSGVLYDTSGLILTNAHVVAGAQSITIALVDGRHFSGKVVGSDTGFDVAIIGVDTPGLPTAPLGSSSNLQVGQSVIAIGNPYGLDHTLTTGVVSALNRPVSEGQGSYNQPMIQTDAAINPGNSGGPLLDLQGRIVGITTLVAAPSGIPAQGLGFAVPVDTARRIADQLVQWGKVTHSGMPYLGANLSDINRPAALPGFSGRRAQPPQAPTGVDHGALVGQVDPSGPSAQAGLKPGDAIISFGGIDVYNPDELLERLVVHVPGDQLQLGVVRNGQPMTLELTIGEAPVQ